MGEASALWGVRPEILLLSGCFSLGVIVYFILSPFVKFPIDSLDASLVTHTIIGDAPGSNDIDEYPSNLDEVIGNTYDKFEQCFDSPSSETQLVLNLTLDPCYRDRSLFTGMMAKACSCVSNNSSYASRVSYIIPPLSKSTVPLTKHELEHRVIFAFIHLNKAGGTTIKREILLRAAVRNKWDAAAFGAYGSWNALGRPWPSKLPQNHVPATVEYAKENYNSEPEYIQCGNFVSNHNLVKPYEKMRKCNFRTIWGAMTLGLCQHFPGKPCIYFIVLRDPVARAISSYNYVCIKGAEKRKKWLPEWKKSGRCPLSLLEFFGDYSYSEGQQQVDHKQILKRLKHSIGTPNKLVERLSRGCDGSCGLDAALQNLKHPCFRFVFLNDFKDGIDKMIENFGSALAPELTALVQQKHQRNKSPYGHHVLDQIRNPVILKRLEVILDQDIQLYKAARALYTEQWKKPLMSCNENY